MEEGDVYNKVERDPVLDRLFEIYENVGNDDIVTSLASLLTVDNYFTYGLLIANDINGRRGKNRSTLTDQTTQLMKYSLEDDVDSILDKRLNQLLIDVLNTYLSDKQILPEDKPKAASGMISKVKALMIMLITTDQYSVIPSLNIPKYVFKSVSSIFEVIREIKEDVLNSWIEYLRNNESEEMVQIVSQARNEFWGTEGIKANVIYDKWFGHMYDRIKHPEETYEAYKTFRADYRKSTKNILPSRMYDIFGITKDAYRRARLNVYNEINELTSEMGVNIAQKLILE